MVLHIGVALEEVGYFGLAVFWVGGWAWGGGTAGHELCALLLADLRAFKWPEELFDGWVGIKSLHFVIFDLLIIPFSF